MSNFDRGLSHADGFGEAKFANQQQRFLRP